MEVHVTINIAVRGEILVAIAAAIDGATIAKYRRLTRLVTLQCVPDNTAIHDKQCVSRCTFALRIEPIELLCK